MDLPLDPTAGPLEAAAQPPPLPPGAEESASSGLVTAGDVLGTAAEVVANGAAEGLLDVVGDAVGGLFSIFD